MSRSLAFFGAFNPPTRAHVDLSEIAMHALGRDEVIFVPSKSGYIMESQKKNFAFSDEKRIEMLAKIAANRPWMRFTDIEMKQQTQPRTYSTLCMLRELGETPAMLVGADKLEELEHLWQFVPEIAEEFGIVVMERSGIDCEKVISEDDFLSSLNIQLVKIPSEYRDISSTRARECLFHITEYGKELKAILPPELSNLPSDLLR